jgi:hypothetical protein
MTRFRIVALSSGVALAAGFAVAIAGTPFGVDDGGFIPPNKLTLKCESAISKAVGKAVACIGKCHASRSSGKLADDTAEEVCEAFNDEGTSCLQKFQASAAKSQSKDTTGGCSCIQASVVATIIESQLDETINSLVYCDTTSGTPFGGDDSGDLPVANSAVAKCEDTINKLVGKAIACVIKCHKSRATGKLADGTAEDDCESNNAGKSCLEKFRASVGKLTGCPNCFGTHELFILEEAIEGFTDGNSGLIYCASPSGAFLQ